MADPGNCAEPQYHLLVDIEHRDQQRERPQEGRAVVLAGLRVGAEGAGVIVADHDDQARPEDRQQLFSLATHPVRGAMSPCRIVPSAPLMWPIWASSRTALGRCGAANSATEDTVSTLIYQTRSRPRGDRWIWAVSRRYRACRRAGASRPTPRRE